MISESLIFNIDIDTMIFRLMQVCQYQFAYCKFTNYELIELWTRRSTNSTNNTNLT